MIIRILPLMVAGACASANRAAPELDVAARSQPAAIARARADSARLPYTEADIDFITGMIGHHAQAILMAGWAESHGASRAIQTLAERVVNAQQDEIVNMQTWLRDRLQPVPEAKPGPMLMKVNGVLHEMLMPGMLTDDQLKQLDGARGTEFDRLFLRFMIRHHKGAVEMVDTLFATDGAGQNSIVFKLASDISVDQTTEIRRMEQMLRALEGSSGR